MRETIPIFERKESVLPKPQAIFFDLDGTLVLAPQFYTDVYTGTLVNLVKEMRGDKGLEMLWARESLDGKGELTLMAMGIPYRAWAQKLIDAPLDLVIPQPETVSCIRALKAKKIIFTGSPVQMAYRLLDRLGFNPRFDFDLIIGWKEPEAYPLKWNNSSYIFETVCALMDADPKDNWEADLEPAKRVGITTIQIRKETGVPDFRFPDIESLVTAFQNGSYV